MDNEMNHVKVPVCGECRHPIAAEKSPSPLNENHIPARLLFLSCPHKTGSYGLSQQGPRCADICNGLAFSSSPVHGLFNLNDLISSDLGENWCT